ALNGSDGLWPGMTIGLGDLPAIPLPSSVEGTAERHASALYTAESRILVLRTGAKVEGRSVAEFIADCAQRRPVFVEKDNIDGLGPWLLLRALLPVFIFDLAPGERKVLPPLPVYRGPVVV